VNIIIIDPVYCFDQLFLFQTFFLSKFTLLGVVAHIYNPSSQDAEAKLPVQVQPGLHSETLSQKIVSSH
jgi:hypothetical protein